jgi:hypothetical protein
MGSEPVPQFGAAELVHRSTSSALARSPAGVLAATSPEAFHGSGGDEAGLRRRFATLMASVARIGADRDLDLVPSSRYTYRLPPQP